MISQQIYQVCLLFFSEKEHYKEKIKGSGKNLLISIIKPAVKEIQTNPTTGAVDK
jgi:hypothetical protein